MAGKWAEVLPNYYLQYRTAKDNHVRVSHQALADITLPSDDAFWISYYPPNGWRCRCNAIQVRKGKYPESDSAKSIAHGEAATSQIGKDGKNKLEIFRFNPGMQKAVFPPKHPYNKVAGAQKVKALVKEETGFKIGKQLKTGADVSRVMGDFATANPEYFVRGYQFTKATNKRGVNGYTTLRGDIYLKSDRITLVKEALNNIRSGNKTTFAQEDAISTMHHEMWHNANKPGNTRLSISQTKTMELANEFVSRKTLPEFMKKLGGELQNENLVNDRKSTGYNKMVRKYDQLVEWSNAHKTKVLESVKDHLISGDYNNQMEGLVKAVTKNSAFKIKDATIETLINYAKDESIPEEMYLDLLSRNKSLLVKK
ncbi:phage head morphogenesis protein [Flavobacterium noncentrifugens]|nr:phage minor head protein [Flavobacterium noncentrifugens]